MKKHILILLIAGGLFATTIVTAQPVLSQAGVAYSAGDVISIIVNTGAYQSPGSSGANQTWNLTTMPDSGIGTGSVVAASSLAISDSFPGATVALVTGGSYYFYNTTSSVMQLLGIAADTTVDFTYVNPEDQLRFPLSYSDTYTDPWRAISYVSGNTRIFSGTTTVTADGYGTVNTPNNSYTNAMRVHFTEHYYDSLYIGIWFVHTWNYDSYRWYVDGNHNAVAETDSTTLYYEGLPQGTSYGGSYLNGPTSVNNIVSIKSFSAFPNPASDNLNIDLNLASGKNVALKIFNAMGAEVEGSIVDEASEGDNRYTIYVRRLPAGIYFARILMDGDLTAIKRFIVAR